MCENQEKRVEIKSLIEKHLKTNIETNRESLSEIEFVLPLDKVDSFAGLIIGIKNKKLHI